MEEEEYEVLEWDAVETYLWHKLVRMGYCPTEEELEDIAACMFEILHHLGIVEVKT